MTKVFEHYNSLCDSYSSLSDDYIRNELGKYDKQYLQVTQLFDQIENDRIKHTVSVYLMGKLLYDNVFSIQNAIKQYIESTSILPDESHNLMEKFNFIWALVALYHDVGYVNEVIKKRRWKDVQEYSFFKMPEDKENRWCPKVYNNDIISSYARYRFVTSRKFDHGIYGAQKFYHDIKKYKAPLSKKYTESVYKCVCWCIASHNIWYPQEQDYSIYTSFGLGGLVDVAKKSNNKIREIDLKKHPLLFLLSLADNIEPYKRLEDENMLKRVSIEFSETSIDILLDHSQDDKNAEEKMKSYKSSILDLDKWLVDVENPQNCTVDKLQIILRNSSDI